jgi:hypothetical protein
MKPARWLPSAAMTRLLLLAAKRPALFRKDAGAPMLSAADAAVVRETVRRNSVDGIYQRIHYSRPGPERKTA